jgi:hypothetical protein
MSDQHKESDDQMEEEPKETNWFSFSMSDFEYDTSPDWNGFSFDDEFNTINNGQLKNQPIILDEADLLKRPSRPRGANPAESRKSYSLRSLNSRTIAEIIFISNSWTYSKRLYQTLRQPRNWTKKAKQGIYSTSVEVEVGLLNLCRGRGTAELSSKLNFRQLQICQNAATEYNTRLKSLIHDFGMSLQVEMLMSYAISLNTAEKIFYFSGNKNGKTNARKHLIETVWISTL